MKHPRLLLGRWLLFVTPLATLCLILAREGITWRIYGQGVGEVATATAEATPLLLHLGEIRRAVRDGLLQQLDADLDADERQTRFEHRWSIIDAHLEAHGALPGSAAQPATLRAQLAAGLARLRTSERRALPRGARDRDRLPAALEVLRVIDGLVAGIDRTREDAAERVVLAHARASELSLFLVSGVSIGLSLVAAAGLTIMVRAERELTGRVEELDAFAGRVAHDLKNTMAPLALDLGWMRSGPSERVARMERCLRRSNELIDGLLAFARSGSVPRPGARAKVAAVVAEVEPALAQLAVQESATLACDVDPALEVAADPVVLSSVLDNLLRNALLHLGPAARREVRLSARSEKGGALLQVTDTGPGIPADLRRRLFVPFERGTDRAGGSGLGLATVKRLVDAHGGRIELYTQVGLGTTFSVWLPG